MTTIDNACDYIILKVCEGGECTSLLKLQKLLYYCQAWNLAIHGERLFDDSFQAWIHGPVSRKIYDRFRKDKSLYSLVGENDIRGSFNVGEITEKDRSLIDSVLEVYAKFSGSQLEQLTHQEDPWLQARIGYSPSQRCENLIADEVMHSYYSARLQ